MRRYSRLLTVEERKHKRKAIVYVFLSIALLLVFLFYGLPTLANISGILSDLRPKSAEFSDNTPPAKPRFITSEIATNSAEITLAGVNQANTQISIFQNGRELEKVKSSDIGSFEKEVKLLEGDNNFIARAKNDKGVESSNSDSLTIILDTNSPEITISEPKDTNTTDQTVQIKGRINEDGQVFINDKIATLDDANNFGEVEKLNSGENKFTIKAIDKAGNITEKNLTITASI